jgi:hypothetical protein
MFPLNGVFNHYMATLDKALPHHCNHASKTPLLQFTGDLLPDDGSGSSSRVFDVIAFFLDCLDVILLL